MIYDFAHFINTRLKPGGGKQRAGHEPFQRLSTRHKTVKTLFRWVSSLHWAEAGC